ncbi:MAG: hypothetical protein WCI63_04580, partial [bacterium]
MTDSKRSINDKSFRAIYLVSCLLAIFLISTVGILAKTLITKGPTVAAHTDHSIDGVCGTTHMTCINDPKHGKCGSPRPSQNCDYPNFMVNFISNGAGKPFDQPPDDDKARWSCQGMRGGKTNQCESNDPVTVTPPPT